MQRDTEDLGDVLLRLRPLPDSVPSHVRLRRLLKIALRGLNLRCVSIEPVKPKTGGDGGMQKPTGPKDVPFR